jgi:hypothetical protein
MNALWTTALYLMDRARCRARAALDGNPESGALTLEWLVIAGILVAAAGATAAWLTGAIGGFEGKINP